MTGAAVAGNNPGTNEREHLRSLYERLLLDLSGYAGIAVLV